MFGGREMDAFIRAFVLTFIMIGAGGASMAAPTVTWEVENRFPFFRKPLHFRDIADVYAKLGLTGSVTALALEQELVKIAADETYADGGFFKNTRKAPDLDLERNGWASAFFLNTCYSSNRRDNGLCDVNRELGDYGFLDQMQSTILFRARDLSPQDSVRTCEWRLSQGPATGTKTALPVVSAPCNQPGTIAGVSLSQGAKGDGSAAATYRFDLELRIAGAPEPLLTLTDQASPRRVVIVGFGDSFASGEGNPDKPARLPAPNQWDPNKGSTFDRSSRLPNDRGVFRTYPVRQDYVEATTEGPNESDGKIGIIGAARWLNPQCHRSLYGHQLKAALHIALEKPHLVVTYLGYACTGAEVTEGLLGWQSARSDVSQKYFDAAPQVMKFLRDACVGATNYQKYGERSKVASGETADATIADVAHCSHWRIPAPDAVLISLGGNDVGLGNLIVGAAFDPGQRGAFSQNLWKEALNPQSFNQALKRADLCLKPRYRSMRQEFERLRIAKPSSMIQSLYPYIAKARNDEACSTKPPFLDVHSIFGMNTYNDSDISGYEAYVSRPTRYNKNQNINEPIDAYCDSDETTSADDGRGDTNVKANNFVDRLGDKMRDAIKHVGDWDFADTRKAFIGHGYCVTDPPSAESAKFRNRPDVEKFPLFRIPPSRWDRKLAVPDDWRAYRLRERWFVTPNDAYLMTNYMRLHSSSDAYFDNKWPLKSNDKVLPLQAATLSGVFHPNHLGQAQMADSVLEKLRAKIVD